MKKNLRIADNICMFGSLAWRMFNANNVFGFYHLYVRHIASETIRIFLSMNDGSVLERVYKKINWYMVEAIIVGEMVASLAGRKMNKAERKTQICLGALMALFDILIDDYNVGEELMKKILSDTFGDTDAEYVGDEAIMKIYYLYVKALKSVAGNERMASISKYVRLSVLQIKSREQILLETAESRINEITIGKGGSAALILASFIVKDEPFEKAIYETGGLIQMMNDCQDMYKDTVAGVRTFVHFRKDFEDVYATLDKQRIRTFESVGNLNVAEKSKKRFLFELNAMFVVIAYKLHRYAEYCSYNLDFETIASADKNRFRINPFSLKSVFSCASKIIRFDKDIPDKPPCFKVTA